MIYFAPDQLVFINPFSTKTFNETAERQDFNETAERQDIREETPCVRGRA